MSEKTGELSIRLLRDSLDCVRQHTLINLLREHFWPRLSYRQAQVRLDQALDPDDPHRFALEYADDAIHAVGDAAFLDPFLATEAKVLRQVRRANQDVPPLGGRRGRAA